MYFSVLILMPTVRISVFLWYTLFAGVIVESSQKLCIAELIGHIVPV